MLKAKIVNKTSLNINFELESTEEIKENDALKAQHALGYHSAGYGFYEFKVTKCPVLMRYKAFWNCQASCD